MKTKIKTSLNELINYSILENKNFLNSQNYVLGKWNKYNSLRKNAILSKKHNSKIQLVKNKFLNVKIERLSLFFIWLLFLYFSYVFYTKYNPEIVNDDIVVWIILTTPFGIYFILSFFTYITMEFISYIKDKNTYIIFLYNLKDVILINRKYNENTKNFSYFGIAFILLIFIILVAFNLLIPPWCC